MTNIHSDMTLGQLVALPEFKTISRFLFYNWRSDDKRMTQMPMHQLEGSGWSYQSILYGARRLQEMGAEQLLPHFLYSEAECRRDATKQDVNILHFPPTVAPKDAPFILICAGGGYQSICSAGEAYPMAASFNAMGYHAFVLTYRVGIPELFPRPLEDVAAALRYILSHQQDFGYPDSRYVVTGCSAGGHLTASWGSPKFGYSAYGLPQPQALFPVYAPFSMKAFPGTANDTVLTTLFGRDYVQKLAYYDLESSIGAGYPPCYITCCEDDPIVPYTHSVQYYETLRSSGIPCMLEMGKVGGHGFGEGRGTDVEGWTSRAIQFLDTIS